MDKSMLAKIFGVGFILVGVLGFVNDPVLGLFEVDTMHNIIHIVSGIAALALGMNDRGAATYGKVFGIIYGLVTILGFIMPEGNLLGMMQINMADNILHLVLTAGLLYLGFAPENSGKVKVT